MLASLRLRAARPVAVAALRAGSCVIEGRVVAADPAQASFAPIRAVVLDWTIESHRRVDGGRRRPSWVPLDGGVRTTPFEIEDATGRVRVEATPGAVRLWAPRRDRGPLPDRRGTRWVACWIGPGDRVRVRGVACADADGTVVRASAGGSIEILRRS